MSTTNWIDELTEHRKYLVSSAAIVETIDPLRLDELLTSRIAIKKAPWKFSEQLLWNLQTNKVTDFEGSQAPGFDGVQGPNEVVLDEHLKAKNSATHLAIKWVFTKNAADSMANWLIEWSQEPTIKTNLSLVTVMTSSLSLFPSEVLRWCTSIAIPSSNEAEREKFLGGLAADFQRAGSGLGMKVDRLTVTPELVSASRGLNLYDLRSAANESFSRTQSFDVGVFSQYKVRNILSAYKIRYVEPRYGFESVFGFEYFKTYLTSRVLNPLVHPEQYLKEGIAPPKGLMMYGPPGVGKTFLAKALAKASNLSVVEISPSDFLSSLVGETEAKVRQITESIESLAPVLVFLDESDQILTDRSRINESTDSGVTSRLISGLLTWLGDEQRKAFVVGATNYLQRIDPAFLRVGRFDKSAILLYPDFASRRAMLVHYINGKTNKLADEELDQIATDTEMWNSAEISALPTEASYVRFNEGAPHLTLEHFKLAEKRAFRVDVAKRNKEMTEMVNVYTTHAPNYEPWLLDLARESLSKSQDKSLADMLLEVQQS